MNRNLKFRAWDKATKTWCLNGEPFHIFGEVTCFDLVSQWIMQNPMSKGSLERMNDVEVVQFTGLLDSQNKEIYEGDIVKYQWESWEHQIEESVGLVFFKNGIFCFGDEEFTANDCNFRLDTLEIFGNIFENLELLK